MKRRQAENNQGTGNALIRAFPVFVLLKYPFTYGIITSAGKSAKADFKHALARFRLSINLNLSQNGVEGRQPPIGARGDSPRSTAPSRGEGVWGWG